MACPDLTSSLQQHRNSRRREAYTSTPCEADVTACTHVPRKLTPHACIGSTMTCLGLLEHQDPEGWCWSRQQSAAGICQGSCKRFRIAGGRLFADCHWRPRIQPYQLPSMGFSQTLVVSNQRIAAAGAPPRHALLPATGILGCQGIPATVPLAARRLPAPFCYQTLAPQVTGSTGG